MYDLDDFRAAVRDLTRGKKSLEHKVTFDSLLVQLTEAVASSSRPRAGGGGH